MKTSHQYRKPESRYITGETIEDVRRFQTHITEFDAEPIPERQIQDIIDHERTLIDGFLDDAVSDLELAGSF